MLTNANKISGGSKPTSKLLTVTDKIRRGFETQANTLTAANKCFGGSNPSSTLLNLGVTLILNYRTTPLTTLVGIGYLCWYSPTYMKDRTEPNLFNGIIVSTVISRV